VPAPLVSVVVPVLDEEQELPRALDHLAALPGRWEVIVVDGGSSDRTLPIARRHPLAPRVIEARDGRAGQMNAGAAHARGAAILFLHADTRLPPSAHAALTRALGDERVAGGNFALRFDGPGGFPRVLGGVYRLQRRFGTFYGDSAIWVRARSFRAIGGYRPLPIMEDHDLARRLRRAGRVPCLPGPAITSSRRWRRQGLARTVASWTAIRWLYAAGVPPRHLARLYRVIR
jgi:rSAM/selenodomain-associated transferase 2